MPFRLLYLCVILTPTAAGCSTDIVEQIEPPTPTLIGSQFNPAQTGSMSGVVTWAGDLPKPPAFLYGMPKADGSFDTRMMPNPNAPAINPSTRTLAGAVVYLKGIDPALVKPWDLPGVSIELVDRQIVVRQGESKVGRVGFVRAGDGVSIESRELIFHILRGRGDDFFSLTFPKPNQSLSRTFKKCGRVSLSSGAGYYWASADLFICDHPYYTVTDGEGRFSFCAIPPGNIEVVAWLPGWASAGQERDPETGLVSRQTYSPALELAQSTSVTNGQNASLTISMGR